MLILRRREGESLVIGEHIKVSILSVDAGGAVSIGVSAPSDVLILRSELQQAARANQDAMSPASAMVQELEQSLREESEKISAPPLISPEIQPKE